MASAAGGETTRAGPSGSQTAPSRSRVLIVHADPDARAKTTRTLSAAGHEVIEATTGEQTLQLVANAKPTLVLLDINLPDIDGYEVCRRIKADPATSATLVIQTAASFVGADRILNRDDGSADTFLTTPTDPGVLVATVRSLLRLRRAEQELRDTRQQHRSLVEQVKDYAIFRMDTSGRTLTWNEGVQRVLGYTEEEFLGSDPELIFTPEDRAAGIPEKELRDAAEHGRANNDRWMLKKGEVRFWASGVTTAIHSPAGKVIGFTKVLRDQTSWKLIDQSLRASEARLAAIYSQSIIGVAQARLDGRFVFVNDRYCQLVGRTREELMQMRVHDVVHPDDMQRELHLYSALAKGGAGFIVEKRFRRPDKSVIWVHNAVAPIMDASGKPTLAITVSTDITERKQAEEAQRESEARFRQLADSMPQMVWTARGDGYTDYYNEQWYDFTGLPRDVGGDASWEHILHPDDLERCRRTWYESVRTGQVYQIEYRFKDRRRGGYRWFLGRALPIRNEKGEVVRWFGSCTDIDDQKRTAEALEESERRLSLANTELSRHKETLEQTVAKRTAELEESHQRLRLSERMALLGTLSAGLGHDMGNLLLPLRVRLESLEAAGLPPELEGHVSAIRTSADYLQRLANGLRLLALDPERVGKEETVELRSWWADAGTVLKNVLPRGVSIQTRLPQEDCWIAMSRPALTQAVFNLVQNAGEVLRDNPEGRVSIEAVDCGDPIRLRISDNGPGMSEDVQRRCMEPFFTTKPRGISTGLGLALVYGLVQDAGGSVELQSKTGEGTTFTLVLPAAASMKPAPGRERRAVVSLRDPRMQAFVTEELRAMAFIVTTEPPQDGAPEIWVLDETTLADASPERRGTTILFAEAAPTTSLVPLGVRPKPRAIRDTLRRVANAGKADHADRM